MSICSCCYNRFTNEGFNVGHWWNNDPDISKVCSVVCKDKLWQMVQDGTWMDHKPVAMFPSAGRKEMEIRQFGIRGEVVPKVSGDEEVKRKSVFRVAHKLTLISIHMLIIVDIIFLV